VVDLAASVAGRSYLVTGASSGLGAHFARLLARSGAHVVAAARRTERLAALESEAAGEGWSLSVTALDVTDLASIGEAVATAAARHGRLDGLVNNAGVAATTAALDTDEITWDFVVDTNLKGAFFTAQAAARSMAGSGGGTIVNVASILGLRVAGLVAPYAISKAGLVQMTHALALEWARHGIRVNALAPGYVETDINREFLASTAGEALRKRIPARRFGTPQDLDAVLLLLAGTAAPWMTGTVVPVDGGHLVQSL
jgi:NAD(P)-dependent dehydrogenase (short-subunit alcohol dehydrogenase family)